MTDYSAIGWREDDLWVVKIPGIGATQGVDRDDAYRMARDCIATMTEVPIEDVTVTITWGEPVWDRMVSAALEIIRRDSGYPSVADMDREMPVWREQCEEIITSALGVVLNSVDPPVSDDGKRCPRCNPDNSCTLWCFEAMIAENTPPMIRELFGLKRERDRLSRELTSVYEWARSCLNLDRDASSLDVRSALDQLVHDSESYRHLLDSAIPDVVPAVTHAIQLNIDTGATVGGMARAAIQALFRHYETAYVDDDHHGSNLLRLYIELWQEFNLLNARRCLRYTCDHLETQHGNDGCGRCSCTELTRTPTG